MSNGRITWQNIAAPDFSTAMLGKQLAADQFAAGFKGIGETLTGINDQNIQDENLAAVDRVLQIQDPAQFDQLVQGGATQGLGLGKGRATTEMLNFISGYDETLQANVETDRAYNNAVYQDNRGRIEDQRADKTYADGQADIARDAEAAKIMAKFSLTARSPEQLAIDVNELVQSQYAEDPKMAAALTKAASGVNPAQFASSTAAQQAAASLPEVANIQTTLAAQENAFKLANDSNEVLTAYMGMLASPLNGAGDPAAALALEISGKMTESGDGEKDQAYADSAGKVAEFVNQTAEAYPGIPKGVIASLVREKVQSDGWIWSGDKLEVNQKAIINILDRMNTPDQLKLLDQQRAGLEAGMAGFANQKAALQSAMDDYAWATTQNEPALAAEALARIQAMNAGLSTEQLAADATQGPPASGAGAANAGELPPSVAAALGGEDSRSQGGRGVGGFPVAPVDPGAASVNSGANTVFDFLGGLASSIGSNAARSGTLRGDNVQNTAGLLTEGAGYVAAVADPRLATDIMNLGRNSQAEALSDIASANSRVPAPAPYTEDVQATVEERTDTISTFWDMAARSEVPMSENSAISKAFSQLLKGEVAQGKPLSPIAAKTLLQRLEKDLDKWGKIDAKEKSDLMAKLEKITGVSRK